MKINLGYIPKRLFNQKENECSQQQQQNVSEPIIINSNLSITKTDILFKRLGFQLIGEKVDWLINNNTEKEYKYQGLFGTINITIKSKINESNQIIIEGKYGSDELQYKKIINQLVNKIKNTE